MAERDPPIDEVPQNLPVERPAYPPGNRPVEEEIHGFWNAANETQRVMKSRHLTMIGMYSVAVIQSSKPSFAQLLVVPSVLEYF